MNKMIRLIFLIITVFLLSNMIIGNILYMNPLSRSLFSKFSDHPGVKPIEFLGSMNNWLFINTLFSIIFMIFLVLLFLKIYEFLPGKGPMKGLSFSLLVILLKTVPESFHLYMTCSYPEELILLQLIIGVFDLLLFGIILERGCRIFKL